MSEYHNIHKSKTQCELDYMIPSDDAVITKEEEAEIFASETLSPGDINKVIEKNIKFVIHIARQYAGYGLPVEDLVNEGVIGFIKAIEKYDKSYGAKLSTFASRYIRYEIISFIISNVSIAKVATTKAHRKLFFNLRKLKKEHTLLTPEKEREEIAEELGVSVEDVHVMEERLYNQSLPFDSTSTEHGGGDYSPSNTLYNVNDDPAIIVEEEEYGTYYINVIRKLININLSERDIDIFVSRNLSERPLKLKTLAEKYGISNERVRQIELKAFNMLKNNISSDKYKL